MVRTSFLWCLLTAILCWPTITYADSPPALKAIGEAADGICGIIATAGSNRTAKASSAVRFTLSGLAKKLGSLGVSISDDAEKTAYDNVLQSDLASDLKNLRGCRSHIFDVLQAKLLPGTATISVTAATDPILNPGSALDNAPGRWTTGPVRQCNSEYYVWVIQGDQAFFRDQSEQVDIERITKVTDKELQTTVLVSVHSPKGRPELAGAIWKYTFENSDAVFARNLSDGRSFKLKRCVG